MAIERKKKAASAPMTSDAAAPVKKAAPRKKAAGKKKVITKTAARKAARAKKAGPGAPVDEKRKKASSKKESVEGVPKSTKPNADDVRIKKFVIDVARMLTDLHFENVLILDVRATTPITDYIMIATGTSQRQIRSVSHEIELIAKTHGISRYGKDEDGPANWIVVDFVDAMIHLFEAQARAHYDLEMLWGDAPKIDWKR